MAGFCGNTQYRDAYAQGAHESGHQTQEVTTMAGSRSGNTTAGFGEYLGDVGSRSLTPAALFWRSKPCQNKRFTPKCWRVSP